MTDKTTIALLKPCASPTNPSGLKLRSQVARVFATTEAAYEYAASQPTNVKTVVLPGTWKRGQVLPADVLPLQVLTNGF